MATIREHIRIDRPADEVWKVVSDAGNMAWFPAAESASLAGTTRTVTFSGGITVEEEIVISDDDLRRFQYRIVGGAMPVESHLGTVDVIEDGAGSLVIYSTDVEPGGLAKPMRSSLRAAVQGLKTHLEG
ncbi:MAG: SRPBCC family protein [Actinomycetes bacterium]